MADRQRQPKVYCGVSEPALSAKSNLSCSVKPPLHQGVSTKLDFLPLQLFQTLVLKSMSSREYVPVTLYMYGTALAYLYSHKRKHAQGMLK